MTSLTSLVCNEELTNETDEDLMESKARRKDHERQEEEELTEELKRFTMQDRARGFSSFQEALFVFWSAGSERRMVQGGCGSRSECNPVLPCHLWGERKKKKKRATNWTSPDCFFTGLDKNWIQQGTRICAVNIRSGWICGLPSVSYCWWPFSSDIPHHVSLLRLVILLSCSLGASPVCQLLYCTTVLFEVL